MKKLITLFTVIALCTLISCTTQPEKIRFSAVYLDMDGTSLDTHSKVRPATLKVLEEYRNCGGKVGLITGRTFEMVKAYLDDVKPNLPLILFNGGIVFSPSGDSIIYKASLDMDTMRDVMKFAAYDGVRGLYIDYPYMSFIDRMNPVIDKFIRMTGIKNFKKCPEIVECVEKFTSESGELPVKVFFEMEKGKADALDAALKKALGKRAMVFITNPYSVEVVPQGVDKASTLKKILKDEGLSIDDVAVFGDSGNDTTMVGAVPVSMAMGNCKPATCDAALFVIGRNDTDAIAEVIRRLEMKEGCRTKNPKS